MEQGIENEMLSITLHAHLLTTRYIDRRKKGQRPKSTTHLGERQKTHQELRYLPM